MRLTRLLSRGPERIREVHERLPVVARQAGIMAPGHGSVTGPGWSPGEPFDGIPDYMTEGNR